MVMIPTQMDRRELGTGADDVFYTRSARRLTSVPSATPLARLDGLLGCGGALRDRLLRERDGAEPLDVPGPAAVLERRPQPDAIRRVLLLAWALHVPSSQR